MPPTAYILSTGTELSSGRSQDTNAPYLARRLNEEGFSIAALGILPDDPGILRTGIASIIEQPEIGILIISGGLGPTQDDHTIDVLARICGQETIEEPAALHHLKTLCRRHPERLSLASSRRQVRILRQARTLTNHLGLAPGLLIEWKKQKKVCLIAALPGVPGEMKAMFAEELLPLLKQYFPAPREQKIRQVFYLYDLAESNFQARFFGMTSTAKGSEGQAQPLVAPASLPADFNWGLSASPGSLRVFWETREKQVLDSLIQLVSQNFARHFLEREVRELLHELCIEKKIKIGTAESCTGGLVAKLITDKAGSSAYFQGSIISYADTIKESHLNVSSKILEESGAVSKECVLAMARGALQNLKIDFSLAISGIAGPGGGSLEKPPGLVYLGLAAKKGAARVHKLLYTLDRSGVRNYSAHVALFYLYRFLLEETKK